MFLKKLLRDKHAEIRKAKKQLPLSELKKRLVLKGVGKKSRFKSALAKKGELHLICELKKASPSAGMLRRGFNPVALAKTFERAGASALSVLTERIFFKGRPEFIPRLKQKIHLPLLRKDFFIDEYQIYESALLGTDAVLLIAMLLPGKKMSRMIRLARKLNLDALVEVHTKEELKQALSAGADMIGINNRNLRTLEVDPQAARKIIPLVPARVTLIVESGIETREQIRAYQTLGVHNFLIGTVLMKSKNIDAKIKQLKGKKDGKHTYAAR